MFSHVEDRRITLCHGQDTWEEWMYPLVMSNIAIEAMAHRNSGFTQL